MFLRKYVKISIPYWMLVFVISATMSYGVYLLLFDNRDLDSTVSSRLFLVIGSALWVSLTILPFFMVKKRILSTLLKKQRFNMCFIISSVLNMVSISLVYLIPYSLLAWHHVTFTIYGSLEISILVHLVIFGLIDWVSLSYAIDDRVTGSGNGIE